MMLLPIVWLPEPASTLMPLPAVLPFAAVALMVSVLPEMATELVADVPVPVKVRLLIAVSAPSAVVAKLPALSAVKKTFVLAPGVAPVSVVPALVVAKFVSPALFVDQTPSTSPFQ